MPAPNHKAPPHTQAPIAPAGDADGAFEAALAARRQGDWQESLGHLQSAIKLAPNNARYHAEAGAALFMLDRHAEAAGAYERALAIDPTHLASLNNLGVIYSLAAKFKEAEALLQQLVAIDPKQFEAWLNLCSAVEHIDGEEGTVVGYANKAVALQPREPTPYMYLGKAHLRSGAPLSALDAYSIALQLGGNRADCHFRIGLCHLALERIPEATDAFQNALQADPCHLQTYHALAELLRQRSFDDLPAAEEACRLALEYENKNRLEPDLPFLYAQIIFAQDRCDDALIWYREAVERKRILANEQGKMPPDASDLILAEVTTADHWAATHRLPCTVVLPEASVMAPPIRRFGMSPKTWPGSVTVPAAYVSEIHNATILPGSEPILVNGEHTALFDRIRLLKDSYNFMEHESIPLATRERILIAAREKSKSRISTGIFFLGHYWQNYAHWIMEHLPRLLLLDKLPQYDGLPILINEGLYPQQMESLQALCGNRYPIQTLPRDHRFEVERLIYPSNLTASMNMRFRLGEEPTPDDVSFHPEAIGYLREKLIPKHLAHVPGSRRLWVSRTYRRNYGHRRLANETEIEALFVERGFEVVIPETLSFRDQVATFAQADMIAGCAGAGMINSIFAPANARILVFTKNHPLVNFHYFTNIAGSIGQSIAYVCGEPMQNLGLHGFEADFSVPPKFAHQALRDFLGI